MKTVETKYKEFLKEYSISHRITLDLKNLIGGWYYSTYFAKNGQNEAGFTTIDPSYGKYKIESPAVGLIEDIEIISLDLVWETKRSSGFAGTFVGDYTIRNYDTNPNDLKPKDYHLVAVLGFDSKEHFIFAKYRKKPSDFIDVNLTMKLYEEHQGKFYSITSNFPKYKGFDVFPIDERYLQEDGITPTSCKVKITQLKVEYNPKTYLIGWYEISKFEFFQN